MSSSWSFFQRRICLSTLPAEWAIAEQEFARVGLTVEKFQSLPDIGPHQSFSKSVREILVQFYLSEQETLLHLEDDCVFRNLGHLDQALSELPADWDIVYLGANLICDNNGQGMPPIRYSEHLFRVHQAWATHAVGYSRKAAYYILGRQLGFSQVMYDTWLSTELFCLNAFCVAPMVAYQRPRFSSIWQREDDYTGIFQESDAKLK